LEAADDVDPTRFDGDEVTERLSRLASVLVKGQAR